ncbi:hypothetical protein EDC01DRAFT_780597 [Geopyxis carbonaria]|nr:hypothetical protein EDC01DRAFT_780597 [Geopyxis carbonaria]
MSPIPGNNTFVYHTLTTPSPTLNITTLAHPTPTPTMAPDPIVVRNRNLVAGFLDLLLVACIFGVWALLEWRHRKLLKAKGLYAQRQDDWKLEVLAQAERFEREAQEYGRQAVDPVRLEDTHYQLPVVADVTSGPPGQRR